LRISYLAHNERLAAATQDRLKSYILSLVVYLQSPLFGTFHGLRSFIHLSLMYIKQPDLVHVLLLHYNILHDDNVL
jgi:hypothetical protein